ncbi:hypothetical protein [Sorangium sp. So ce854]|uniref:hypothetical protein n=1 Tax=Sorangium sp. So ce854 TaxID=3133322 RepID=UPI003F5F0922
MHRDVVRALLARGKDVRSVLDEGMGGRDDVDVLRHAHRQGRVVLTRMPTSARWPITAASPFSASST